MTGPISLESISLRRGDRMLLAGGTGTGKSTLTSPLIVDFLYRYTNSRVLVLDTKPRFRAEWELTGISTRWRYRRMDHGETLPHSVVVHTPGDLANAWRLGHRVAIAQTEGGFELARLAAIAQQFYQQSRASRPQLLVVDEMMDWYSENGGARAGTGNTLIVCNRAGRERGLAVLDASQRLRCFPTQILELMNRCALFRLDVYKDIVRLVEFGAPPTLLPPEEDHLFNYWTKLDRRRVYGPYRLAAESLRRPG